MHIPQQTTTYALALLSMLLISIGQILFKQAALQAQARDGFIASAPALWIAAGLAVYVLATALWIWLLRAAPLSAIYPIMAIAYVLVPILSHWLFGEHFGWRYLAGTALILAGVVLTASDQIG